MPKKPAVTPRGYRTCTATLAVSDVPAALSFYQSAFGASVQSRDDTTDTRFAAIKIGSSMLFVSAGWAGHGHQPTPGAASVAHHMYVADVDAACAAARDAGAQVLAEPALAYWGERCATIADPFGHVWTLATRVEALSAEEIAARGKALAEAGEIAEEAPAGAEEAPA
ncbi:VOC family protein [Marinovum sp.]|uniref:VOC family protein n=1 Tax=Marinovum sp. TaxID=2024839 RepID=UPI002B27BA66|nr:VOC family protein [Marinovum sp.]